MSKLLSLLSAAIMVATFATACGGTVDTPPNPTPDAGTDVTPMPDAGTDVTPTPDAEPQIPSEDDLAMCNEDCQEQYGTNCAPTDRLLSYMEGENPTPDAQPKLLESDGGWICVEPEQEEDQCVQFDTIEDTRGWTCEGTDIHNVAFGEVFDDQTDQCWVRIDGFGSAPIRYQDGNVQIDADPGYDAWVNCTN